MTRRMTLTVDPSEISMAAAIRRMAGAAPLLCLTSRALGDLADELGSMEAAADFLLEVAESIGHPIAVNVPTGPDASSTTFLPPKGWSEERLAGWVAGKHEELEREFGQVTRLGNRAERRRRRRGGGLMQWREERWALPDQPRGSGMPPAVAVRLGTVQAVGLLLLAALNLAVIAQLAWLGGNLGRALVGLALAVAVADVAVALLLVRPWWLGWGEGTTMSRLEQRRQERLARRAEREGLG